ncbi:MAG TPA: NEW3 domain-containing protein, partial [Corynebacterium sp.]|nr:NEW3 domain-containing protein [Corynebacterium sp.]
MQPNSLTEDVTYWLTDTIPAGLTYVPGSASASAGTVDVTGNTLTWVADMTTRVRDYVMSTSNEDPACVMPLANSGAYTNLQGYGISTQSGITGDSLWYGAFTSGAPINYWGADHTGIDFTDDGMVFFSSTPGATPWINQSIPNSANPNNLLAMFWSDFEVVYDAATNRGVSLATIGGTGAAGAILIEYDDVVEYGGTDPVMDFEVLVWRTPFDAPGNPEIIFAYDNIAYTPQHGTVGIENAGGTDGIEFAFDDERLETITDGMAICFDWAWVTPDPVTITYSVTVDATTDGTVTNNVESSTSNPGSKLETISTDVEIDGVGVVYGVELSPDQAKDGLVGTDVSYTLTVTNSGNVADSFTLTVDGIWAATVDPVTTQSLAPGESATLEVIVTVPDDAEAGDVDLTTVTATSVGDDSVSDTAQLTTT